MDRQPRYGVGDLLYIVLVVENLFRKTYAVATGKIMEAIYIEKTSCYGYMTRDFWVIENTINVTHDKASLNGILTVFDTREQAYQAVCKLIDSDIESQLDEIGVE